MLQQVQRTKHGSLLYMIFTECIELLSFAHMEAHRPGWLLIDKITSGTPDLSPLYWPGRWYRGVLFQRSLAVVDMDEVLAQLTDCEDELKAMLACAIILEMAEVYVTSCSEMTVGHTFEGGNQNKAKLSNAIEICRSILQFAFTKWQDTTEWGDYSLNVFTKQGLICIPDNEAAP